MYIKRKLEDKILKYLNSPEIIAVVGPRQCGKTTLLKKVFEDFGSSRLNSPTGPKQAVFATFEDKNVLSMFENNLKDFTEMYVKNKKYLFIDEFQYAKKGGEKLKYIFDLHKIKIFISGSSSVDLTVNTLKYLVGRIFVFNLHPLDFEEFLSYKDAAYRELFKKFNENFKSLKETEIGKELHDNFLRYYEEYVIFGGYPRVVLSESPEEKKEVLKNIYNTYFLREVRDILGLIDDYKLEKLIKGLALQVGNLIEYKELSRFSEYNYPALKKYLNFLEKTFICGLIKPYFRNKRIEIVKNPKVYFFDTGLRNAVVNDFRKLSDRGDGGCLLENALFQQLVRNNYFCNYWRDKKGREIDFILKPEGQEELAVEVKSFLEKFKTDAVIKFKELYPAARIVFAYQNIKSGLKKEGDFIFCPIYAI